MRALVIIVFLLGSGSARAERIVSYVNEAGVKVFTNIGTNREALSISLETPAQTALWQDPASAYLSTIEVLAPRFSLDAELVKAIVKVESNFNPRAVSPKDCKGLMQLHPDTARRFGVRDIFDPTQNLEGGMKYLQFLMGYFNQDLNLVLAAYNAGENAVVRHNGIPPYQETQDYVRKVNALYTPPETEPRKNERIYRVELADGRILFTNTPEEFVEGIRTGAAPAFSSR